MENKKIRKAQVSETSSDKFMLEEYVQLHEEKRAATDRAETRVNFFFAICSAAVGSIVVLAQTSSVPTMNWERITIVVLAVLLLYGLSLLNRVIYRDIRHHVIDLRIMEVQKYFSGQNRQIETYIQKIYTSPISRKTNVLREIAGFLAGGLIGIVILTNSLICGALVFTVLLSQVTSPITLVSWSILTIIISAVLFYRYNRLLYSINTKTAAGKE